VQGALGNVEEQVLPHLYGATFYRKPVVPREHVEELVLTVLDVGWPSGTGERGDLEV
jgi:hypothetical protein